MTSGARADLSWWRALPQLVEQSLRSAWPACRPDRLPSLGPGNSKTRKILVLGRAREAEGAASRLREFHSCVQQRPAVQGIQPEAPQLTTEQGILTAAAMWAPSADGLAPTLWLTLLAAAGWLSYALWPAAKAWLALQRLPSPAPSNRLLGHLQMLQPNHHRFMRASAKQHGGIYLLRVLWQQVCTWVTLWCPRMGCKQACACRSSL